MTDQVIISRSTFEKLKNVFKEKNMKIRELEKDNEVLKNSLPERIVQITKTKNNLGCIEIVEPVCSGDGVETVRKCTQGVSLPVCQKYSAPSTLTQDGHEFSESQEQASYVRTHSHQSSDEVTAHKNKAGTAVSLQSPVNNQPVNTHDTGKESYGSYQHKKFFYPAATFPAPCSDYLQRLKAGKTDGKAQQYLSPQNEFLSDNNASPDTPIVQEHNSSSQNSQSLLRSILVRSSTLAYPQKPPCSQMDHQTPPSCQNFQSQKHQPPDPDPGKEKVNNPDNSSYQSFLKHIGQNQSPSSKSQNALQGTVIDQRYQEPLASKDVLSTNEILIVKDIHIPNTLSSDKNENENCFEIIYENVNRVTNQSRDKSHKNSLPSVKTSLIPHALDSKSHNLKAVPPPLKNKPVLINHARKPLKLDGLRKSKLMSRNSLLSKNSFTHKKLDINRDFPSLNQSSNDSIPKPSKVSSLVSSVAQVAGSETTQDSFTPEAVANTLAETFPENGELSSNSSVCFEESRDSVLSGKPKGSTVITSNNNIVVDTVPSVPIMHNSNTNNFYESQSGVAKQKDYSFAEKLSKKNARPLIVSERNEKFIPDNFGTFCLACKTAVTGKKIFQHLLFGHIRCKRCDLNIKYCHELVESERIKHQCKNAFDKMHDFFCLNSDLVDDQSYNIIHSHYRGEKSPMTELYLLKKHIYLNSLKSVFSIKPCGSIFRKDQQLASNSAVQLASNSAVLPSSNIYSDSSAHIADSKRKSACEEGKDFSSKSNDNLSGHLIESDISMQREVHMGRDPCSSDGNINTSNVKDNSKSSVNSESCSISRAIGEESCRGSVKSKVRPSVVLGVSKGLLRSESSSISSTDTGEGSKEMINSQTCSIDTPIVKEDPKRLLKIKLKTIALQKRKRFLEAEKSNKEIVAKSSGGELVEKEVLIQKTYKREKTIEEQEKTDDSDAIENSDWENIEANFLSEDEAEVVKDLDIFKEEIPELNEIEANMDKVKSEYFLKDSWAVASLQPVTEYVTMCSDNSTAMGRGSQSCSDSSDKELMSQNEIDRISDSRKNLDMEIEFCGPESDSEAICDTNSISKILNSRRHYSQDSDEKHLLINFQTVETTGLSNVKCPEECPMCYTVLCPSRFHMNIKTFHLSSRCIGCGLFITITLGDCKKPSNTKRIYKCPGPKSKTDPLASKKQKRAE